MIIAIDGPAASGKSTVAKRVAFSLGFEYLDTGAMYRAVTLKALERSLNLADATVLGRLAKDLDLSFSSKSKGGSIIAQVFMDGRDISEDIRSPKVTANVSAVAKIPEVRCAMVGLQRRLAEGKDVVVEGRDVGTNVFPEAKHKFFLIASAKERAERRHKEFDEKGYKLDLAALEKDIASRDAIDTTRKDNPLRKADDAVLVDTTGKDIDMVVSEIMNLIKSKG